MHISKGTILHIAISYTLMAYALASTLDFDSIVLAMLNGMPSLCFRMGISVRCSQHSCSVVDGSYARYWFVTTYRKLRLVNSTFRHISI